MILNLDFLWEKQQEETDFILNGECGWVGVCLSVHMLHVSYFDKTQCNKSSLVLWPGFHSHKQDVQVSKKRDSFSDLKAPSELGACACACAWALRTLDTFIFTWRNLSNLEKIISSRLTGWLCKIQHDTIPLVRCAKARHNDSAAGNPALIYLASHTPGKKTKTIRRQLFYEQSQTETSHWRALNAPKNALQSVRRKQKHKKKKKVVYNKHLGLLAKLITIANLMSSVEKWLY